MDVVREVKGFILFAAGVFFLVKYIFPAVGAFFVLLENFFRFLARYLG